MHKNPETGALDVANDTEQLFRLEPRIREICGLSTTFIDNIDSTNMLHTHWERIVEVITNEYDKSEMASMTPRPLSASSR